MHPTNKLGPAIRSLSLGGLLALTGCGADCQSSEVQRSLFEILRQHVVEVMGHTDQTQIDAVMLGYDFFKIHQGTAGATVEKLEEFDSWLSASLVQTTKFSFNSLTELRNDPTTNTHVCRGNVRVDTAFPKDLFDFIKQHPTLDPQGRMQGNVALIFTVRPDLTGAGKFYVEANWDDARR